MTIFVVVLVMLLVGASCFVVAAVRDARERGRQVAAMLVDIENRDLRLATRWVGR